MFTLNWKKNVNKFWSWSISELDSKACYELKIHSVFEFTLFKINVHQLLEFRMIASAATLLWYISYISNNKYSIFHFVRIKKKFSVAKKCSLKFNNNLLNYVRLTISKFRIMTYKKHAFLLILHNFKAEYEKKFIKSIMKFHCIHVWKGASYLAIKMICNNLCFIVSNLFIAKIGPLWFYKHYGVC